MRIESKNIKTNIFFSLFIENNNLFFKNVFCVYSIKHIKQNKAVFLHSWSEVL